MDLSSSPAEIVATIISQAKFRDLASLARVSHFFAAEVRREYAARIGRHYELIQNHRVQRPDCRTVINAIWNLPFGVTDRDALLPLVMHLMYWYKFHEYYDSKVSIYTYTNSVIYARWIHIGLAKYAQLLQVLYHSRDAITCPAHPMEATFWEAANFVSRDVDAYECGNGKHSGSCVNVDDPCMRLEQFRQLIDGLDMTFTNLLAGVIDYCLPSNDIYRAEFIRSKKRIPSSFDSFTRYAFSKWPKYDDRPDKITLECIKCVDEYTDCVDCFEKVEYEDVDEIIHKCPTCTYEEI